MPTLSLGGEFTRAAGRKRPTGHRGASVSEWESEELSPQEFTICIVTLNLQKRKMSKTKCFAAQMCYAKLFQVSATNGSPKTALIPDTPASPPAVHNPASWLELASRIAGSGRTPDPLIAKRKE